MKNDHQDSELINEQTQRTFDRNFSAASATDCTGLTPAGIHDDEESEAYLQLYDLRTLKRQRSDDRPSIK